MGLAAARRGLHAALDPSPGPDGGPSPLNRLIVAAIVVSVAATVLETEETVATQIGPALGAINMALGLLFLLEYLARLWVATETPGHGHPLWGRLRYALSAPALIDLAALTPLFLAAAMLVGFAPPGVSEAEALRMARLLRVLRILRLGRFSQATMRLAAAVASRRFELGATLLVAGLLLLVSSTLIYFAEGAVQPDAFGSIPRAMWWSIATLTTVGYGDVTPVTPLGKILAGITAIIGIGLIAMPTGILAAALSNALQAEREARAAREKARERARHGGDAPPPG